MSKNRDQRASAFLFLRAGLVFAWRCRCADSHACNEKMDDGRTDEIDFKTTSSFRLSAAFTFIFFSLDIFVVHLLSLQSIGIDYSIIQRNENISRNRPIGCDPSVGAVFCGASSCIGTPFSCNECFLHYRRCRERPGNEDRKGLMVQCISRVWFHYH